MPVSLKYRTAFTDNKNYQEITKKNLSRHRVVPLLIQLYVANKFIKISVGKLTLHLASHSSQFVSCHQVRGNWHTLLT